MALDRQVLGEAIHASFRKASDDPIADIAWRAIRALPDGEWSAIVAWIADAVWIEEDQGEGPHDV